MKLTHRLFALTLAALAPAIGIQVYNEVVFRRAREAEVRDIAVRSAQQAASELDRVFEGVRNLLTAISAVDAVQALDTPACVAYLAKLQPQVPHLLSLAVIDRDGRVRCRQVLPMGDVRYADRPYFQEALATDGFVLGQYTQARVAGKPVLPAAMPLRDHGGRVVGVVAVAVDLEWLTERLRERGIPPDGSVTVADRDGVIVAREPFPERFIGTRIPQTYLHLVTAPAPGAITVESQDGTPRVLGYVPVADAPKGLYVSAGLSTDVSYANITRASRQGLILIALGGALAILAAWLVGRAFIRKPVEQLLRATEAWRAGRFDVRAGLAARQGDFGRLGEAFDRVVDEVARREDALRESEARFRELADSAPVLIWMSGPDKGGTYFNKPWLDFTGRSLDQERGEGWLAGIHPKDLPALEACGEAFAARRPFSAEFRLRRHDGQWRWLLDTGVPRFGPGGAFEGFIGSCIDITERRRAEEHLKLLLNELNHRVKNTLATVQSLATQTLRASETPDAFRAAFEARLLALSKTHNLLTEQNWEGAALIDLVAHEVAPYARVGDRERLVATGEAVRLAPQHALALGMAFHELATNAAKYGALSTEAGWIELSWHVRDKPQGGGPRLHLSWTEHDGPPVRPSERRGFGSRLIDRSLRAELGGRVVAHFDPAGLRVVMEVPLGASRSGEVPALSDTALA